ncbi:MAG: hypothetical protein IT292_03540 [Deltaproteobacteria bacterium]|nr:hypothetical protein [Deltaproteobacteria bacterium]
MRQRVLICFFICLLGASSALAEDIVVRILESFDQKKMEIPPGRTATINVFLQTFGSELVGYNVLLYRDKDKVILAKVLSDEGGEVIFGGVPAGEYTLVIDRGELRHNSREGTVRIGDVRLYLDKPKVD